VTLGVITLLYWVLAGACASLSFWFTFDGFRADFGWVALPVAFVLAVGLFSCDLAILDRRRAGESILGIAVLVFVLTGASFISNFNFVYTHYMLGQVVSSRWEPAFRKFEENMGRAESALWRETKVPELREKTSALLRKHSDEVTDPTKPGRGPQTIAIEDEVRAELALSGVRFQPLQPIPVKASEAQRKAYVDEFARRIKAELDQRERNEPAMVVLKKVDETRKSGRRLYAEHKLTQAEADLWLGRSGQRTQARIDAIRGWETATKSVELEVNQYYRARSKAEEIELVPTPSRGIELGKITFSLNSAREPENLPGGIICASFSVLLDLLPLLFVLLVRPVKDAPGSRSPSRPAVRRSWWAPRGVPLPRDMRGE